MTGVVCAKCGEASNEPRHPQCAREDCPGREVLKPFVHATRDVEKCTDGGEHDFKGWRDFEDGSGGEQVCSKCGVGAMAYSLRVGP